MTEHKHKKIKKCCIECVVYHDIVLCYLLCHKYTYMYVIAWKFLIHQQYVSLIFSHCVLFRAVCFVISMYWFPVTLNFVMNGDFNL